MPKGTETVCYEAFPELQLSALVTMVFRVQKRLGTPRRL